MNAICRFVGHDWERHEVYHPPIVRFGERPPPTGWVESWHECKRCKARGEGTDLTRGDRLLVAFVIGLLILWAVWVVQVSQR